MISLLNRNDGKLELDMAMGPRDFAQSRLLTFLEEDGWIVCGTSLSSWKFTEVIQQGDSIYVTGSDFPGTSLLEFLYDKNSSEKNSDTSIISILKEVFRGMELVVQQKPEFQLFGPAQILVEKEKDSAETRLLFLPPTLFKRAIESRSVQEQGQLSGCYCNPQLQGTEAMAFSQGVYLYKGLSGQLPFPQREEELRWADYRDKNFMPLEFLVPGLPSQVADAVNNNLQLGTSFTAKKKNTLQNTIKDTKAVTPCEPVLLHSVMVAEEPNLLRPSTQTESTEFIQRRESYQQQQEKELHRKRFIRKYSTWIKVALAVVAVGMVACISGINKWRNEFVSTGLSPAQVCGVLYTALDEQNLVMAKAMCTGSGTKEFQERLSNFFISNRMRTGMNPTALAVTPSQWVQYLAQQETQEHAPAFQQRELWIYGVTNFHLEIPQLPEEALSQLPVYPPLRKDKLRLVEGKEGEKLQAVATYSLVYSDGLEQLQVEHHRDSLTLEYKKQSWQVVSVEQEFNNEMVERSQIEKDFTQLLKELQQENEENQLLPENPEKQLLQAYPWLGNL